MEIMIFWIHINRKKREKETLIIISIHALMYRHIKTRLKRPYYSLRNISGSKIQGS